MLKKIEAAKAFIHQQEALFQCPKCQSQMKAFDYALRCKKGHTYELSKKGTLFFLEKPIQSEYTKEMFLHRKKAIQTGLYQPMLEKIFQYLMKEKPVLDVGCGEGSFLSLLGELLPETTKLGFDISKEGIYLASDYRQDNLLFQVADLTSLPYENHSMGTILNIFSPSNYREFRRVLTEDGLLIKVIPGSDYLKEIRQGLYVGDKSHYSNEKVRQKLEEEVEILEEEELHYASPVAPEDFLDVVKMTPLSWSAEKESLQHLMNHPFSELTIHVHVLKCRLKETKK